MPPKKKSAASKAPKTVAQKGGATTTGTKKESAIPVGTQFAPSLVDLKQFLAALVAHSGSKAAVATAVWAPAVRIKAKGVTPSHRTMNLPVEAAVQYGLLDKEYAVTPLATELAALSGDALYERFAKHILLNLGGLRVLEAIRQMVADHLKVTGDSLARFLTEQGFEVTEHNTAINSLRLWLAKAGVFPEAKGADTWEIDELRVEEIVPLDREQIAILAGLTNEVQAFVRALCRANPTGWVAAADIRDAAESAEHVRIGRTSLPNEILKPLEKAGLIEFKSGGTKGGKSATLKTKAEFDAAVLQDFMSRTVKDLDASISDYYRRRPADIFSDLNSTDTFVKGRALEAFAIMVMRQLGLRFVGWNKRAPESTAQAEVDVVLSGLVGAVQTRWQLQCKNTPNVNLDVRGVASEVGLLPVTQATHILIITRGGFTKEAKHYANTVMSKTPISIFLFGSKQFEAIKKEPSRIFTLLKMESRNIARLQPAKALFGGL